IDPFATPTPFGAFDPFAPTPDPFANPQQGDDGIFQPPVDPQATLLMQQTIDASLAMQSPLATPAAPGAFDSPLATPISAEEPVSGSESAPAALAVDPALATAESATMVAVAVAEALTAAAPVAAPPSLTPTPTLTPTITPTPLPTVRPIVLPPAPPLDANLAGIFSEVVRSTAAAAGLIFFVAGVIVFFGVAGLVIGLSYRWGERRRYQLYQVQASEVDPTGAPPARDNWPSSLP
ncbi:MAG: hypothetical protein ACRC1H_11320, partial [Caldilineaceae bacterium]